jgi:hypothetical protein
MEKKQQKEVRVLPNTVILVDIDADEEKVKAKWLQKYHRAVLSDEQIRRERVSIREGKVLQRKQFK